MRTKFIAATLLFILVVATAQCSGGEREEERRELSIIAHEDSSSADGLAIVRLQRALFSQLARRQSVEALTHEEFTIRREPTNPADADSIRAAEARRLQTFRALNVRPPLDTTAIIEIGDLMAFTEFESLPLSARQIIVIARREGAPVLMTNWLRHSDDWRAISITLNPSDAALARLYQLWSTRANR
jgi:hypothetical protein